MEGLINAGVPSVPPGDGGQPPSFMMERVKDEDIEKEWLAADVLKIKREVKERREKLLHRAPSPAERMRQRSTKCAPSVDTCVFLFFGSFRLSHRLSVRPRSARSRYAEFLENRAQGGYSPVREELRILGSTP